MNSINIQKKIYFTCLILISNSISIHSKFKKNKKLPTVAIITTGGTIAQKKNQKTGELVPVLSGEDLINTIPEIKKLAKIKIFEFSNIDSSQITPEIWKNLAKKVDTILKKSEIIGAIISHGTDTMVESAYFLNLTLKTKKPVVFVGSMKGASSISPDGPENIYNAILQVTSNEAKKFGVTITLNQYINSARTARKTNTTNIQTFNSGQKGFLGYISINKVYKFHEPLKQFKLPIPKKMPHIPLIKTFVGDKGDFIRYSVDNGTKGIVIEALGAGNVNKNVYKAIQYALSKKVIVVITTRVPEGAVLPIYGGNGGGYTLKKEGVILAGDLPGPKSRILLILALGNKKTKKEIEKLFNS